MFGKKKRLFMSADEKYRRLKRRFYILLTLFVLFLAGTGYYLYLNYDYLVFKHLITHHYVYTDTLNDLYEKELKRDVNGKYYQYFDNVVMSAITREIRETNNDRYTYQYLPEQYEKSKQNEKTEADGSSIKPLGDDIIYVKLTNYSKYTKKFVKDNINTLKKYPNIIIDLQDNPGGDISVLYYLSDLFLPNHNLIATDITRSKWFSKEVKSKRKQVLSYNKIIILQNKNSASASEGFISALKDNLSNVTLIGETTFGKGIGQLTLPLRRGFAIKATTLLWNTPNDKNIQTIGIEPDISYTNPDIIDFAVTYIRQ